MLKCWGSILVAAGMMLVASATFAQDAQEAQVSCDTNTDIDGDGITGPRDFAILKGAYGTNEGDSDFVAAADLNHDGWVTTLDYQVMLVCN